MAVRINVTAIRHAPPAEVRAVMSEVIKLACPGPECRPVGELLDVQEHGGWTWFTTSVWGVSAADLNRGLCRLARPALQFTTCDGDRWYLTVHGGPGGQVHFVHQFGYHAAAADPAQDAERQAELDAQTGPVPIDPRLEFLEEDRSPSADRPRVPFDLLADNLSEVGGAVPEEFRASVADLPYSAAAERFREWHAAQLSAALAAASIPHDPAAVRSVLLWERLTEAETGSDLGNLPRLLAVLGLGGTWDDWVRQAEAPPASEPVECAPEPAAPPAEEPDRFTPVLALVGPLGLTPVVGGPVALPLEEMTLFHTIVEALSIYDTAGVVLEVALPPDYDRARIPAPSGFGIGTVEHTADGFRVGLENHVWFSAESLKDQLGEGIAERLYHLPDGSRVDVAFALADRPALMQRYRGPVADGRWQIAETYPALDREALTGALEWARYASGEHTVHELRDEAEAEAVVEAASRDQALMGLPVLREGRTVRCPDDFVGSLINVIFRHRYRAFWDVAAHDREAARLIQEQQERQRQMRRAGVEAARRRAAPHDSEVLYRGKQGFSWRSDFARLDTLEQETREKVDGALAGLGFRHVGDLVAKKQRDIVLRAYVSADASCYGLLMAKRTMYLGYEFFSRFADGSRLTTTTNGAADSLPDVEVYIKVHPGFEPAALHEKHRWGVERFRTRKGTEPVALGAELVDVAREYDEAMARREEGADEMDLETEELEG